MKQINFYEVTEKDGINAIWGGASALTAVEWYRRNLGSRIYVSIWDEKDPENPILVTDKIEVTKLIEATIYTESEKV